GKAHRAKGGVEATLEAPEQRGEGGEEGIPSAPLGFTQHLVADRLGGGVDEAHGPKLEAAQARLRQPGRGTRGEVVALQVGVASPGALEGPLARGGETRLVAARSNICEAGGGLPGEEARRLLLADPQHRELGEVDGPEEDQDEDGQEEREFHGRASSVASACAPAPHRSPRTWPRAASRASARPPPSRPRRRHPSSTDA